MTTKAFDNDRADDILDPKIHAWLKKTGHIIPTRPEDVLRAEGILDDPVRELPEGLADPEILLQRIDQQDKGENLHIIPLPSPEQDNIEKAFARAARQGGKISHQIEERMQRDRESYKKDDD